MGATADRRQFLKICGAAAAALAGPLSSAAVPRRTTSKSYTYKIVSGLEIKADVYRPADDVVRPVVIWLHGGALITGHRKWIDSLLWYMYQQAGFALVSIDYRLAPETKLPSIVEDLRDAYEWVRVKGPGLFSIDPSRVAVSGGSAGGYLTLMTGFCVDPRPNVLVSLWGYGDITGDWYSQPSPFYSNQPAVTKEEAYKAVGDKVIAGVEGQNNRWRFYLYCRQQGLWPLEVGGRDPRKDPKWFDQYCPLRNVTKQYPPTMLIHGQEDTDVPHEQSALMAGELDRAGVEHKFISIPNAGHGLWEAGPDIVAETYERAAAFVQRYV